MEDVDGRMILKLVLKKKGVRI